MSGPRAVLLPWALLLIVSGLAVAQGTPGRGEAGPVTGAHTAAALPSAKAESRARPQTPSLADPVHQPQGFWHRWRWKIITAFVAATLATIAIKAYLKNRPRPSRRPAAYLWPRLGPTPAPTATSAPS
jgi:hypothetical protein